MSTGYILRHGQGPTDFSVVTAEAEDVLSTKIFLNRTGALIPGSMALNSDVSASMNGTTVQSVDIPKGFTNGGTVSLDSTIYDLLSEI